MQIKLAAACERLSGRSRLHAAVWEMLRAPSRLVRLFSLPAKQPLMGNPLRRRGRGKTSLKVLKRKNEWVVFNPPTGFASCGISVSQARATCVSVDSGIPQPRTPCAPFNPSPPPALTALPWLGGRKEAARGYSQRADGDGNSRAMFLGQTAQVWGWRQPGKAPVYFIERAH